MQIKIKSLQLTNFKGVQSLLVPFTYPVTEIAGKNATGKTTIFDAFTWLLFGKDSSDRKDFDIKPLDQFSKPLQKAEYEVTGLLNIDGQDVQLRRVLKEKWVKKRGSEESEFTGHETNFFVNDVPTSLKEYQEYINSITPEQSFKLITNPSYFNNLKKEQRREMLLRIAGEITPDMIVANDKELRGLLHLMLTNQITIDQLQKSYAGKRKRLKEELEEFPARISEAQRSKTSIEEVTVSEEDLSRHETLTEKLVNISNLHDRAIESFEWKRKKLAEINDQIMQRQAELRKGIYSHQEQHQGEINKHKILVSETKNKIAFTTSKIADMQTNDVTIEGQMNDLRAKFTAEAAKVFTYDQGDVKCKCCGQELPNSAEKIDELKANFNQQKTAGLEKIQNTGVGLKTKRVEISSAMLELKAELEMLNKQYKIQQQKLEQLLATPIHVPATFNETFNDDLLIIQLNAQLEELRSENEQKKADELQGQLREMESEKASISDKLSRKAAYDKQVDYFIKRIEELNKQQKTVGGELASIERDEFLIEKYNKIHNSILEEKINSAFELVTFRMYTDQINGGEAEVCETLINGVPFSNANHAAQINAGIDICNTFSRIMQMQAPIWADNAEAVNTLHKTPSQLIKLTVTNNETLTIK